MLDLTPYNATCWLIDPPAAQRILAHLHTYKTCYTAREVAKARRKALARAEQAPALALASTGITDPAELQLAAPGKSIRAVKGKVGVIPVHGPVEQRMSSALMKAGGTSSEEVGMAFDRLMGDPAIGAVVLHYDSPGGDVAGTQELADKIYGGRGRKPIYAIADSAMASASFWTGTAADLVASTPGGLVGSHGVYTMHVDQSKALEKEGVAVTFVSAGKYKTDGSPYAPLGDEAKAHLQGIVDYTYAKFTDGLKRNRGTTAEDVRKNYGQGRVMTPEQAVAAGAIDRIMTFEALMQKLTGGGQNGGAAKAASTQILKLRHEQRKRQSELLGA